MLNNDPDLHVDNIFRALGSVGRYQLTQVSVGCLIVFVSSGQLLNNVFIAREVPHHCAVPSNGSSFWERYSSLNGSDVTYEKCEVLITRGNETVGREPCPDGVEYEVPEDISVASQFNLVCDQKYLGKLSQTMAIIGQGVGAFFLTIVSDRFGRKLALVGSNFAMLVCGLAVTFSQNYPMFAVSKFFIGVCQQGIHASNHTFMLEMFPLKARRVKSLFSGLLWSFGSLTMMIVSYLLQDYAWRYTQLTLTLFSLSAFFQMWYMDESIRWLIANGRSEQALKCVKRAARMNKKNYDVVLKAFHGHIHDDELDSGNDHQTSRGENLEETEKETLQDEKEAGRDIQEAASEKLTMINLMKKPRLLANTLAVWLSWFTVAMSYFAIYLTLERLHGSLYLNFAITVLVPIPVKFIFFFAVNRLGRKVMTIVMYMILGGSLLLSGIFSTLKDHEHSETFAKLAQAFSLLSMLGASGAFGAIYFYTPELYPTNVRNQALGIASAVGRLGGMLGPFAGILAEHTPWGPGAVFFTLSVLVILLTAVVLPETKTRELPQTLDDVLDWYKKPRSETNKKNVPI